MKIYLGICKEYGEAVYEDEAEEYVNARGYFGMPEVLIPWFFSGNWIEVEDSQN